jgi:hypothetical protein
MHPAVTGSQSALRAAKGHSERICMKFGDFPSWVAAVGTVGALVAALWQIRTERHARKRLEEEVRSQARRAQAVGISAWIPATTGWRAEVESESPTYVAALFNHSEEPVYMAIASLVSIQGAGPSASRGDGRYENRAFLDTIPPGRYVAILGPYDSWPSGRAGVDLAFTDAAGVHWLRRANGALEEIDEPAYDYYGLGLPLGWSSPYPEPTT